MNRGVTRSRVARRDLARHRCRQRAKRFVQALRVVLSCFALGCQTESDAFAPCCGDASGPRPDETIERWAASMVDGGWVPANRAEAVALAERLLRVSDPRAGLPRARRMRLAGELYAHLWRVEHLESDARSAIELLRGAADLLAVAEVNEACLASLTRAELEAERSGDARALFEAHYEGARFYADTPCGVAMDRATRLLAAYRPPAERLGRLAAQAAKRRSDRLAKVETQPRASISDDTGLVVTPAIAPTGGARLLAIVPYSSRDRARVVVTLSRPVQYEVGVLAPPTSAASAPRALPVLYVDIAGVEASAVSDLEASGLVQRIQVRKQGAGVRLELQLAELAYRRVFFLPEPFRILIDVATTPPAQADAAAAKRAADRVVLDPGHGGSDPGAIGPSGLKEKDVTLDIAHRAAPVLSRELGIPTLLTRDGDRFVALEERTARANAFHADLFLSIHCNASDNSSGRGVTTFVLDATRDDVTARVAARENATSLFATPEITAIAAGLRRTELMTRSSQLADLLQRSALASLAPAFRDTADLGVRTAGFFVLVGADMPGVLFETSFISNPMEEKRLATPHYRQKLADAIVNAVRAYRAGR